MNQYTSMLTKVKAQEQFFNVLVASIDQLANSISEYEKEPFPSNEEHKKQLQKYKVATKMNVFLISNAIAKAEGEEIKEPKKNSRKKKVF